MVLLFVALFLFFAVRALTYFSRGRAFAGSFATLACMLFLGAIYVDYAGHGTGPAKSSQRTI